MCTLSHLTLMIGSIVRLTVSKNLIPYSSARAWPFAVGTAWKLWQDHYYQHQSWIMNRDKGSVIHTLLLSSISALFPTKILFTLSEACCSILRIQFLMSAITLRILCVKEMVISVEFYWNQYVKDLMEGVLLLKDDSSVTSYTSKMPIAPR